MQHPVHLIYFCHFCDFYKKGHVDLYVWNLSYLNVPRQYPPPNSINMFFYGPHIFDVLVFFFL